MAKIISFATTVPPYKHTQQHLLEFMEGAYGAGEREKRILNFLYSHSGIETRYSVIPDFTLPVDEWKFFPRHRSLEPFPGLEYRMQWFMEHALALSSQSAEKCMSGVLNRDAITHIITVSCTGMLAPGLEVELIEALGLERDITRYSINFMGCYAAVHGLKMANDIVNANPRSKVLLVCTEICSLHFQKTFTEDAIMAPLLFGDGSAAVLVCDDDFPKKGLRMVSFYSALLSRGRQAMTWKPGSHGFEMSLTGEVPDILKTEIAPLKAKALANAGMEPDAIRYWCIHPGGKRILEAIGAGLSLDEKDLQYSYQILREYGNMSSPTILFVLNEIWTVCAMAGAPVFAAAFGPGLVMESIILTET